MPESGEQTISRLQEALTEVNKYLEAQCHNGTYWEGYLAESALATAVAVFSLACVDSKAYRQQIELGQQWLRLNQNSDGGWGDTVLNESNLSTTLLCRASLRGVSGNPQQHTDSLERSDAWLRKHAGGTQPDMIANAVLDVYGNDRTFSAPILSMCAVAGELGSEDHVWEFVPQLPFELGVLPQRFFKWLRLPVVSYAIPALIAVGLLRHRKGRSRSRLWRLCRTKLERKALAVAGRMHPSTGGFLEAVPLTGFVLMCLASCGYKSHPVADQCVHFIRHRMRPDGSWPIDTNLSVWLTSHAAECLFSMNDTVAVEEADRDNIREWLLAQQYKTTHPYTGAPPGGWAWTHLSGGVPDADDTAGALSTLHTLHNEETKEPPAAVKSGMSWLRQLQNSDGGFPTFCRGWGKLPFDQSCPDITAHVVQAFIRWYPSMNTTLQRRLDRSINAALRYLKRAQSPTGTWAPLWFGNENAPGLENPVYGTAKVITALRTLANYAPDMVAPMLQAGDEWLIQTQNPDGGWGGTSGLASTVEETAVATAALADSRQASEDTLQKAGEWLIAEVKKGHPMQPAPIGLYFSRLWYWEALYPTIFTSQALGALLQSERLNNAG